MLIDSTRSVGRTVSTLTHGAHLLPIRPDILQCDVAFVLRIDRIEVPRDHRQTPSLRLRQREPTIACRVRRLESLDKPRHLCRRLRARCWRRPGRIPGGDLRRGGRRGDTTGQQAGLHH